MGVNPENEKDMLEITQRYFVRFILCMDKRSPSDSCISNVGLWTIESYSDKMKLLCLGRSCRTASNTMHKQLFNLRVGQILVRQDKHTSLTLDFIKILDKYDMTVFLENYLLDGFFFRTNLYGEK